MAVKGEGATVQDDPVSASPFIKGGIGMVLRPNCRSIDCKSSSKSLSFLEPSDDCVSYIWRYLLDSG